MEIFKYKVLNDDNINNLLNNLGLSIHKINHLLNTKKVSCNKLTLKPNDLVKKDDLVVIDISEYENIDYEPTYFDLDILYEDEYLLVINKPDNTLIYDENNTNTLANYVRYYFITNNINRSIRHVHRLDKDTTGCILYAKDIITHAALSKMLENNQIIRLYHAEVVGKVENKGTYSNPIGKDRHHNNKMVVSKNGQKAITNYKLLKYDENKNTSLVEIKLDTGRTHQIRVHFSYNLHPLIGDSIYNPHYSNEKLQLTSYSIEFIHPITRQKVYVNV